MRRKTKNHLKLDFDPSGISNIKIKKKKKRQKHRTGTNKIPRRKKHRNSFKLEKRDAKCRNRKQFSKLSCKCLQNLKTTTLEDNTFVKIYEIEKLITEQGDNHKLIKKTTGRNTTWKNKSFLFLSNK